MSSVEETIVNRSNNLADGMEKFTLDGVEYSGFAKATFMWEKSYVKSPVRSGDGSIGNLETYTAFKTPHYIVEYSVMSISDYRSIMKQYLTKNEFTLKCYDPIYNEMIERKVYFATPEQPKYFTTAINEKVYLTGVENYTIELIGTNNDIEPEE